EQALQEVDAMPRPPRADRGVPLELLPRALEDRARHDSRDVNLDPLRLGAEGAALGRPPIIVGASRVGLVREHAMDRRAAPARPPARADAPAVELVGDAAHGDSVEEPCEHLLDDLGLVLVDGDAARLRRVGPVAVGPWPRGNEPVPRLLAPSAVRALDNL